MTQNNKPMGTGANLSPTDYRDKIAAAAVAAAPAPAPRFTLPPGYSTDLAAPMMQALQPACVSHSVIEVFKLFWFREHGVWVDFSPRFLDILCKRFDGQDRITGGTYPRLAFKLLATYGCATTATLLNDTSLPVSIYRQDSMLTDEVMADAAKHKSPGYVSVPVEFYATRQAIDLYGAISSLFLIGDEFWLPSWADSDIDPLRTPEKIVSGHQITPKGWTPGGFNILRNSWSEAWANKGESRYNFQDWVPFTAEQWRIAQIPADVADMLKDLPSPAAFHYQWNTTMLQGNHNNDVKFLQIALMILGYLVITDPAELGYFGPKTTAANYKFQVANGIPPAGDTAGPLTRGALNKRFAL